MAEKRFNSLKNYAQFNQSFCSNNYFGVILFQTFFLNYSLVKSVRVENSNLHTEGGNIKDIAYFMTVMSKVVLVL